MRALGASLSIAGKAITIEAGENLLRIAYARDGGRVGLALYQLKKSITFRSEASRAQLISKFEALGFKLSSSKVDGEPSFNLPKPEDSALWNTLRGFFADIFNELAKEPSF